MHNRDGYSWRGQWAPAKSFALKLLLFVDDWLLIAFAADDKTTFKLTTASTACFLAAPCPVGAILSVTRFQNGRKKVEIISPLVMRWAAIAGELVTARGVVETRKYELSHVELIKSKSEKPT